MRIGIRIRIRIRSFWYSLLMVLLLLFTAACQNTGTRADSLSVDSCLPVYDNASLMVDIDSSLLAFFSLEELNQYIVQKGEWAAVKQNSLPDDENVDIDNGYYVPDVSILSSQFHLVFEDISLHEGEYEKNIIFRFQVNGSYTATLNENRQDIVDFGILTIFCGYKGESGREGYEEWKNDDNNDESEWLEKEGVYYRSSDSLKDTEPFRYTLFWEENTTCFRINGMPAEYMDAFWENRENLMEWVSVD